MPLTRVSLLKGKPPEYRQAILGGLYQAMRESFDVPEDDRFMTIEESDKSNFVYGENYPGIARDDDLVIVQITVNNTRGPVRRAVFIGDFSALERRQRILEEDPLAEGRSGNKPSLDGVCLSGGYWTRKARDLRMRSALPSSFIGLAPLSVA